VRNLRNQVPVQAIGGTFNAEQIRIAKQKEKAKKAAVA